MAPGLRQRKKQRTRRALIETAARLFAQQGYDQTTIAEIAEAVEIAPRTFFSYFPTKEDVLFADTDDRIRIALDAIAATRPGERAVDTLLRALELMMASIAFTDDLGGRMGPVRLKLLESSPAVQAGALRRFLRAQVELSEALWRAHPEALDEVAAAAVTGALLGAVLGAAMASLHRGDELDRLRTELRRAIIVAMRGIAAPVATPG
jgi:AcrR family transcriptional regulator